jgi:HPt (histidine-containing phosphotransfer) domain-containing protein
MARLPRYRMDPLLNAIRNSLSRSALHPTLALLALLPQASREGMVRMYRDSLQQQMAFIGQGLQGCAIEAETRLLAAVHKIAGSAGMMQDQALSLAARAMETALRDKDRAMAHAHWDRLQACGHATLQALAEAYPPSH